MGLKLGLHYSVSPSWGVLSHLGALCQLGTLLWTVPRAKENILSSPLDPIPDCRSIRVSFHRATVRLCSVWTDNFSFWWAAPRHALFIVSVYGKYNASNFSDCLRVKSANFLLAHAKIRNCLEHISKFFTSIRKILLKIYLKFPISFRIYQNRQKIFNRILTSWLAAHTRIKARSHSLHYFCLDESNRATRASDWPSALSKVCLGAISVWFRESIFGFSNLAVCFSSLF